MTQPGTPDDPRQPGAPAFPFAFLPDLPYTMRA